MEKLVVILGPTAVGKTALSFALAERFQAELVSADAYQIYRHMDIGTAKPSPDELTRYRHHLIDTAAVDDPYSAALFCGQAAQAITDIEKREKLAILVGGTGLYVQSLLEGYRFDGPQMDEVTRRAAQAFIEQSTEDELQQYIRDNTGWQPQDWHELFRNSHRLVRLVAAIKSGSGRSFIQSSKSQHLVYDAYVIGLMLPRDVLYERIDERVDLMLANGWIEEVEQLLRQGADPECQAMKAIGYGEIAAYLQGSLPLADAATQIKRRTRRFAKRQITWYKRMPYIHWYHKEEFASEEQLAQAVIASLNQFLI